MIGACWMLFVTSPGGTIVSTQAARQTAIFAASLLLIGTLLSGPIGLLVVQAVHPQPPWQDAQTFVAHYHPVQTFPFFAGFLLVLGSSLLVAALYHLAPPADRPKALLAVMCTAAFAALIFFNYTCQTTFVPALLADYKPEYAVIISTFSFSNPRSLCWALEMWGYALLGVATWLLAPVFHGSTVEKMTAGLMIANGVVSVAGGFISALDLAWVMTLPGMINYIAWNALVILWAIFVIVSLRRRTQLAQAPALPAAPATS
jgi:hypothetical protein